MRYKWILKFKLIILSLLLFSTLGNKCHEGPVEETPPDSTGCGVGAGDYEFELVNTLPGSFNCNDSGRFVITIPPQINTSYYGTDVFNRLYFILDNGIDIYLSNYVEFLTGNTADQQLQWGGSLPTGEYEVCARMKNIQLNSTCRDSIHRAAYKDLGEIYITEFTYPEKVMQIEYDCQLADTLFYRYDIFDICSWLDEYMDIAFNIANTTYNIIEDNKDLPSALILNTTGGIRQYIYDHKLYDDKMYLCGIKGFKDTEGRFIDSLRGASYISDTITYGPSPYNGSLVAVKACINYAARFYDVEYNDWITATTIHELGHQRGIPYHHVPGSGPRFCIMNPRLLPFYCNTYSNPHFCDICLNRIKNFPW